MIKTLVRTLAIGACALTVVACGPAEEPVAVEEAAVDGAASATESLAEPTEPPPTEAPAEAGTRENPVPIGTSRIVGDWNVTVNSVDFDAAEVVAAENQFNDPPAEGHVFVMLGVSATYAGTESGTFWIDTSGKILGADGNTFDDTCGVIPDSLTDAGETFNGATIAGNLCYSVEAAQVDDGLFILEESFSLGEDNRAFFALK